MSASKKLIALFVDDDCDDVDLLRDALVKTQRFDAVHCFDNGADALAFMLNTGTCPDVIVVDLSMPQMSGLELLEAVRKINQLADIPILIFTGSTFHMNIDKARAAGANGYIIKPNKAETYNVISGLIADFAENPAPREADKYYHHFSEN